MDAIKMETESVSMTYIVRTSHLRPCPTPTYWEGWRIAGLKCGAITF